MSVRYTPTPLPKRLDINRDDSGSQINSTASSSFVSSTNQIPKQKQQQQEMNKMFHEIVITNLREFIDAHLLSHPGIAEDSLFEQWVREFHSEYDDAWYSKNRGRLFRSFRPIWDGYFNEPVQKSDNLLGLGDHNQSVTATRSQPNFPDLLGYVRLLRTVVLLADYNEESQEAVITGHCVGGEDKVGPAIYSDFRLDDSHGWSSDIHLFRGVSN